MSLPFALPCDEGDTQLAGDLFLGGSPFEQVLDNFYVGGRIAPEVATQNTHFLPRDLDEDEKIDFGASSVGVFVAEDRRDRPQDNL